MSGYVFYSKKCKTCHNLISIMESQGLVNMFEFKSIDDMSVEDLVKRGLKIVPTIVVVGTQGGRQQSVIYENKDAFEWVKNVVTNRRQNMIMNATNTRKLIQANEMKKRLKDGMFEYCEGEIGGVSDAYAYYKEGDDLTKDIECAQPKSFVMCGQYDKNSIITIPIDKNAKGYKFTKVEQEKMIRDLASSREKEDSQLKSFMEQQQIQSVATAGNNSF